MAMVTVKSARKDGRVAFFEKDQAHPGGEIFVRGDQKQVDAGDTVALRAAIRKGNLVEVTTQAAPATKQTPATKSAPWEGYDDASAEDIIERLRGMEATEREKALDYERANKKRVTITRVQWNS